MAREPKENNRQGSRDSEGDELVDRCTALYIVVKRMYGFAPRGKFINDTHMQVAIDSHRQCARDRGRGHHQHMWWSYILLP